MILQNPVTGGNLYKDGTFLNAHGISKSIHGRDEMWGCNIKIHEMSTGKEREELLRRKFDKWINYRIYDVKDGLIIRFTPEIYNE